MIFASAWIAVSSVDAQSSAASLTPPSPPTPRIHGAKVFGSHPGSPFLFTVPATGDRPLTFSADNLPAGLALDSATGRITGTTPQAGDYTVTLHAKNSLGETQRNLIIKAGGAIALTPPMGWNSWNCFASAVSDEKIRAAADAMAKSGLINHGWTYVNIDDCWEGNRDAGGLIQSNQKFPDMKALGDHIHGLALKFGIYSSPGPRTCAGYTASYQHEDQDAQRYGEWGVDYVKYDWCSYGQVAKKITADRYASVLVNDAPRMQTLLREKEGLDANRKRTDEESARLKQINSDLDAIYHKIDPEQKKQIDMEILQAPYKQFRDSLAKVNRDIVFSFCQYGMGDVWKWGADAGGNSWRTTGDITDNWGSMIRNSQRQIGLESYVSPGHWNDPDMLVVGQVGWGPKLHATHLTPDEQYTHISLWCLQAAPLLIGCDLTQLDPFTLGLLTNDEVIDVDQDPLGQAAHVVKPAAADTTSIQIWAKPLEDGALAVGLFNPTEVPCPGSVNWSDLQISGSRTVRDLWRQNDLGAFDQKFESQPIPPHGVLLIRVAKP